VKNVQRLKPEYIDVAASIIADISSGIYRTPANALKELVSNSFDVGATEVYINTGYSNFDVLTVSDNGTGMSIEDFIYYMKHIGGSVKRIGKDVTEGGRPIIGKIGIGVLAVSQICKELTVISSDGNGKKFEATIDLSEFEEIEARKRQLGEHEDSRIRIGKFQPVLYDEQKGKRYTMIMLKNLNEGFSLSLKKDFDLPNLKQRVANPQGFLDFVREIGSARRGLTQFTEYDRLIWEMAIMAPVRYLDQGPIMGEKCIPKIKNKLDNYHFRVIVDGLELRKPILFPLDEKVKKRGVDYGFVPVNFNGIVGSSRLKFEGYVYFQRKAIIPPELRGVLIRIRNVAIGYYDKSLLHYPLPTGPIANQVSMEIHVEEGLENALNIDRNSFRETDLHYLAVQRKVFEILAGTKKEALERKRGVKKKRLPVFDKIRLYSKRRRDFEARKREKYYLENLENTIRRTLRTDFSIEEVDEVGEQPLAMIDSKRIRLYNKNFLWPKRRDERNVFRKLLIFKEISENLSESIESAKRIFYQLLERSRK